MSPAAFRRLCVETAKKTSKPPPWPQPPSGGCVLKLPLQRRQRSCLSQPPSGGCVLKQPQPFRAAALGEPAAFRRLCVETSPSSCRVASLFQPPSSGCVLKQGLCNQCRQQYAQPPSGGCVLKQSDTVPARQTACPAAFGQLCVETAACCHWPLSHSPATFRQLYIETVCHLLFSLSRWFIKSVARPSAVFGAGFCSIGNAWGAARAGGGGSGAG